MRNLQLLLSAILSLFLAFAPAGGSATVQRAAQTEWVAQGQQNAKPVQVLVSKPKPCFKAAIRVHNNIIAVEGRRLPTNTTSIFQFLPLARSSSGTEDHLG